MSVLGNILWFIFGGFITALLWLLVGCLWCITVIGIPIGLQAFKMAKLSLAPFGKTVTYGTRADKIILNVLWIIFGGLILAIQHFFMGIVCFISLIGIPFGIQYFKLAKLALMPFGAEISKK